MKQIWVYSFLIILIFSCQPKEKTIEEENVYPRKKWFSVSENDRRLDSLKNDAKNNGLEVDEFRYFNPDYSSGKIHFVILNETNAVFFNKSKDFYFDQFCGYNYVEDSIYELDQSFKYLDSLQSIDVNQIKDYLTLNKESIIADNEFKRFPSIISFSLKYDTLKGSFMHDILTFMENNGMNYYFIRRMNDKELEAVEDYSE